MMPVTAERNAKTADSVDYKKKYKVLKKKLRFLLYEHECFLEELRKSQRKLLKISRDKTFLLDRLLQYEKVDDSSSDSEATASSDSESEGMKEGAPSAAPKRKAQPALNLPNFSDPTILLGASGSAAVAGAQPTQGQLAVPGTPGSSSKLSSEPPRKRPKVAKKPKPATIAATLLQRSPQSQQAVNVTVAEVKPPGPMTREELERHLEFKQSTKPQFMSIEKATHYLPDDIFSNENSNSGSDRDIKEEIDDLVIDVPKTKNIIGLIN